MDDNLLNNMFGDIEIFSDSHSESDWSDIGILDNLQDSIIFDWQKEVDLDTFNNINTEVYVHQSMYPVEAEKSVNNSSPFDTHNFPTSVNDISNLIEIEPSFKFENSESFFMSDPNSLEVSYNITVPVIHVEDVTTDEHAMEEDKEEKEEDQISINENLLQPSKRRHQRKYSSTDETESDEEWAPTQKCFRRKPGGFRRISTSKTPSPRPIPQRRSPGTKLKITQWIVELLRDPKTNPRVITWVDEKHGVFMIKNTSLYANLWGKVKQNSNMTYEKLSRAMRYSYKNDELRMIPDQRLTYKFGANMVNFRAEDPTDPNFELLHQKSSS